MIYIYIHILFYELMKLFISKTFWKNNQILAKKEQFLGPMHKIARAIEWTIQNWDCIRIVQSITFVIVYTWCVNYTCLWSIYTDICIYMYIYERTDLSRTQGGVRKRSCFPDDDPYTIYIYTIYMYYIYTIHILCKNKNIYINKSTIQINLCRIILYFTLHFIE